jgi:hypothetical protein
MIKGNKQNLAPIPIGLAVCPGPPGALKRPWCFRVSLWRFCMGATTGA